MSAFKDFTKINLVHKARVQRQRPGAKTTEVEAPHGNLRLVCACQPSTAGHTWYKYGQLLRSFQVRGIIA